MAKNVETRGTSHWRRKIMTIVSLPVVISLWMVGWALTQIGHQSGSTGIKQKINSSHAKFEAHKRFKTSKNKDSRIVYKPDIIS